MSTLKQRALHAAFRRYYARRLPQGTRVYNNVLDYPVQTSPRYPLGQRPHPRLARWFEEQHFESEGALNLFESYRAQLEAIPMTASDELDAGGRLPDDEFYAAHPNRTPFAWKPKTQTQFLIKIRPV